MKINKFIVSLVVAVLLLSNTASVFAADSVTITMITQEDPAYQNLYRAPQSNGDGINIMPFGTGIPTATMNLAVTIDGNGYYGITNFVYSNYKYQPSSNYFYISVTPLQAQTVAFTVYDSSTNTALANYNAYTANLPANSGYVLAVGGLSTSKSYYVKFSSPTGALITANYVVAPN